MTLDVSRAFFCFVKLGKRSQKKRLETVGGLMTHERGHDAAEVADAQLHSNRRGTFALAWLVCRRHVSTLFISIAVQASTHSMEASLTATQP